jgi:hypothetical protein
MVLPAHLLRLVEDHPCFSGVWEQDCSADCVADPSQPPLSIQVLHCDDCLTYHVAVDTNLLPSGTTNRRLGEDLTAHVRQHRGYSLSVGGYHLAGGGLWLSAAYWPHLSTFVLHTRSNHNAMSALDALIEGIQFGVVVPPDPRMNNAALYDTFDVYLSVVPPPKETSLQALLSSSHVSAAYKTGFRKVTLAGFRPLLMSSNASASPATAPACLAPATPPLPLLPPAQAPSAPVPLVLGDLCPVCNNEVRERWLFSSNYVGCLC